jgi:hypothetical protein
MARTGFPRARAGKTIGIQIAILAPPWIPVPPPGYGGIAQVVQLLSGELVERGHEVRMYAALGSRSAAEIESPLDEPHPDEIQQAICESDHVACAFDSIDAAAEPFDVVHDHCGFTGLAFANRLTSSATPTGRRAPHADPLGRAVRPGHD